MFTLKRPVFFLFVCVGTLLALASIPSATARQEPSPQFTIPTVTNVSMGCTSGHAVVTTLLVTPPGWQNTGHVVHLEGLFDGAWRAAPTLNDLGGGRLLVDGPYGRWRAYVTTAWQGTEYSIVGPAAGPFGDLCDVKVDRL